MVETEVSLSAGTCQFSFSFFFSLRHWCLKSFWIKKVGFFSKDLYLGVRSNDLPIKEFGSTGALQACLGAAIVLLGFVKE